MHVGRFNLLKGCNFYWIYWNR